MKLAKEANGQIRCVCVCGGQSGANCLDSSSLFVDCSVGFVINGPNAGARGVPRGVVAQETTIAVGPGGGRNREVRPDVG